MIYNITIYPESMLKWTYRISSFGGTRVESKSEVETEQWPGGLVITGVKVSSLVATGVRIGVWIKCTSPLNWVAQHLPFQGESHMIYSI